MTWPVGFWAWFDFFTTIFFAFFMLDRARLMYVRSRYRDRLGWSLIVTDAVVGVAYLFLLLIVVDPVRYFNSIEHKVIRVVGVSVIGWTWVVMRRTKPARMEKAMSGDGDG